ncbi:uncharacterized protein LY89DRAFT_681430 [Mollisia scopiformis]|uniref:Uncharacterized protein n=1 Tax=Mollisia scopiformis TaxID=149040 RepID=A0A194XPX2_MOLSC|nr:uncharacterized protein LY89DRAFT_681430 [Mollisia scopiformis]KUJ22104.1 hypothetical protein LY89DRAFT_681430 [Mollisia scopiformis]
MLDENLPTFYLKPSSDNPLSSTIFLSEHGSELQPEYTLRRPDPKLPGSKNCYAVALYDSYNPEVLYAEVLVHPEWQAPTLSAAEIRAQNGIPPPPVPIVPNQFAVQLYNPDQQVMVRQIPGTTFTPAHWEFEMPQTSFRTPSASALDRSQSDPAASDITPKISFKWKRDGKLSKDISCFLYGKSTDGKKNKDPDIVVAMYKNSNLTVYQPNMHRVEVEDTKGLEVVLILGAAVIKDIYFNASRELFNIGAPGVNAPPVNTKRKNSGPVIAGKPATPPVMSGAVLPPRTAVPASQIPPQQPPRHAQQSISRPPAADPRTQWEIDAETERLKKVVEAEDKAREKAERAEEKRIRKMLEQEEKEARKRQAEVDKETERETERLRKQYGVPAAAAAGPSVSFSPSLPQRPQQQGMPQWQSAPHSQPPPVMRPQSTPSGPGPSVNTWLQRPAQNSSPYLQAPGNGTASSSGFFGLGGKKMQKKRSVFF